MKALLFFTLSVGAVMFSSCASKVKPTPPSTKFIAPKAIPVTTKPVEELIKKQEESVLAIQKSADKIDDSVNDVGRMGDTIKDSVIEAYSKGLIAGSAEARELKEEVDQLVKVASETIQESRALKDSVKKLANLATELDKEVTELNKAVAVANRDMEVRDAQVVALETSLDGKEEDIKGLRLEVSKAETKATAKDTTIKWLIGIVLLGVIYIGWRRATLGFF